MSPWHGRPADRQARTWHSMQQCTPFVRVIERGATVSSSLSCLAHLVSKAVAANCVGYIQYIDADPLATSRLAILFQTPGSAKNLIYF